MKKLLIIVLACFSINRAHSADLVFWKEHLGEITIERFYLQQIFTKRIAKWPDGTNINVYIKPLGSIEHKDFLFSVLGLSPFAYSQQLEAQTFTGKATSVIEVANDTQLLMKIEKDPRAIGYINYDIYIGNKKVVVVDGDSVN